MIQRFRSWMLATVLAALLAVSTPVPLSAEQACWGSCGSPGVGECYDVCAIYEYYLGRDWIQGCGWCYFWACIYVSECLFGGGCNCDCYSKVWADGCEIPV